VLLFQRYRDGVGFSISICRAHIFLPLHREFLEFKHFKVEGGGTEQNFMDQGTASNCQSAFVDSIIVFILDPIGISTMKDILYDHTTVVSPFFQEFEL